jgi:hypothetical protein
MDAGFAQKKGYSLLLLALPKQESMTEWRSFDVSALHQRADALRSLVYGGGYVWQAPLPFTAKPW